MPNPQQPELARARRSAAAADPGAKSGAAETLPAGSSETGPVPEDNRPGHRPSRDQDKPTGPPRLPEIDHRFAFRFDNPIALAARAFGVRPENAYVRVHGQELTFRFGPWVVRTTTDNVAAAEQTGPYQWWKVAGPARLSLADRGVTFATTTAGGVCIRFEEPVTGGVPGGWLRHPGVTVTVEDGDELVRLLNR